MTSTVQRYQPPANGRTAISQATAVEQSRAIADVQAAVTVAQNCPRDMAEAEREMEYVCGRLDMAEQAFYQVTNRGSGPSVHLMRELARIWGNVDYGVKELARNDDKGESEVLATCWDMQKNTRSSRTFIVPHQRMSGGHRAQLVDLTDIYLNNQNVGARAVRECIATILPRWFTEKAQTLCSRTLQHGEGVPLQDRINAMVVWFRDKIGVTEKQLEARIGKKRGAWSAEDVAQMKIAGGSISRGEVGRDEVFPPIDAETVEDLACATDAADGGGSKLSGKVKAAGGPGQDGGNDASQGAEPSSGATFLPDSHDQDATEDAPHTAEPEPPGAPTENTPGQTDRVQQALSAARTGQMTEAARQKWIADIDKIFAAIDCTEIDDQLIIIAHIIEAHIAPGSTPALSDASLKKVGTTLERWWKTGEIEDQIIEILNQATLAAENQDD